MNIVIVLTETKNDQEFIDLVLSHSDLSISLGLLTQFKDLVTKVSLK